MKSYLAGVIELFGTAAAASMVLFYALEERGPQFTLAFSASCLAAAGYALAIGSWPFFTVETVWACVAARRGLLRLVASR